MEIILEVDFVLAMEVKAKKTLVGISALRLRLPNKWHCLV